MNDKLRYILAQKTNLPDMVIMQELRTIDESEVRDIGEVVEFNNNILEKLYPSDTKANTLYIDCDNWEVGETVMYKYVTTYLSESLDFLSFGNSHRVYDYSWYLLAKGLDKEQWEKVSDVELLTLTVTSVTEDLLNLILVRERKRRPTIILDISDFKTDNHIKRLSTRRGMYIDLRIESSAN